MKSPLATTILMGSLAAGLSLVAAINYPWPEAISRSDVIGKPLIEAYENDKVRAIRILKFDSDSEQLERIQLRRSGEKWIIPAKKNFIANNATQVSQVINSLLDLTVLEEKTDLQQDYAKYGVVDPADYEKTPNRSALGVKIVLEDRNRKTLGSLIVGSKLKDDRSGQKFSVRIPSQPSVYVVEFDARVLSTDFRRWVNPNLFRILRNVPIDNITIENYRLDPKILDAKSADRQYRAELGSVSTSAGVRLDVKKFETASQDKTWQPSEVTPAAKQKLLSIAQQMISIQFPDVLKKKKDTANALRSPTPGDSDSVFDSLKPLGFVKTGFENSVVQFDASGGEVSLTTSDGVVVTLYIGNLAAGAKSDDLKVSYYSILTAGVDESVFPIPEKPASTSDPQASDKEEKQYLQAVKDRKEDIQSAKVRASAINQQHANWIYLVSEDVVANIRPDVELAAKKSTE